MTRIKGSFPIFASKALFGEVKDLSNNVYEASNWKLGNKDNISWERGLFYNEVDSCNKKDTKVSPEKLNGIFNYITNSIKYLYDKGVPEYCSENIYDKNSVVSFNGNLYISLLNGNNRRPTVSKYWKNLTDNIKDTLKKDINPIGTILTVPKTINIDGYIDYTEGETFNHILYPELFKVLTTNKFGSTGNTIENNMPIGSLVYSLNTGNIPNGWVEWNSLIGNLSNYPKLKEVLENMVRNLPLNSEVRLEWEKALAKNSLPNFDGKFFIRKGNLSNVGEYLVDSVNVPIFNVMPMVIDNSNTLNPLGFSRKLYEERVISPIASQEVTESLQETNVVITGQRVDSFADLPKPVRTFKIGSSNNKFETYPKHINARLLIKADNSVNNIPSTHKQIIKAFEV